MLVARCLLSLAVVLPVSAQAAEVSFVSGLYQGSKKQENDQDAGKESTIELGGRFADLFDTRTQWFAQGLLSLKSYDAGSSGGAPSDSTTLAVGGGLRYYFQKLAEHVTPFVYGLGQFKNQKDAEQFADGFEETESNGLFYGAATGLRLGIDSDFFLDLEARLFESALFATDKTETTAINRTTGQSTKTTVEKTRNELYVDASGTFSNVIVALGWRF